MPRYLKLGSIPPKRHIMMKTPTAGFKNEGIYYEEVITTQGFSRAYSTVYHMRPPTRVRKVEPAGHVEMEIVKDDVLRHRHIKTGALKPNGDVFTGRVPFITNNDVTLYRCRPATPQVELFRNNFDEIVFVHNGKGFLHTHFGALPFKPYDYIVIPKTTTFRFEFDAAGGQPDLLVIETKDPVGFPPRYLNPDGQFRLGAPFCERDLHGPTDLAPVDSDKDVTVVVKDGSRLTRYTMAHHPFDVVGWDGLVYPFTFNADDFETITGLIHQPPPIHQTFETAGFVVCTFAPRTLDLHPESIKVPYAHSNVESDEVLYYVRGHFGSRKGVEISSFTLHPSGLPHGPHPGTIMASMKMTRTDELAVMVDTFRPLFTTKQAAENDDPAYPYSWMD